MNDEYYCGICVGRVDTDEDGCCVACGSSVFGRGALLKLAQVADIKGAQSTRHEAMRAALRDIIYPSIEETGHMVEDIRRFNEQRDNAFAHARALLDAEKPDAQATSGESTRHA